MKTSTWQLKQLQKLYKEAVSLFAFTITISTGSLHDLLDDVDTLQALQNKLAAAHAKIDGMKRTMLADEKTMTDLQAALIIVLADKERAEEDAQNSWACLSAIADVLEQLGCACETPQTREHTPPMMYPEWIGCTIKKQVEKIKADMQAELDAALAELNTWKRRYESYECGASATICSMQDEIAHRKAERDAALAELEDLRLILQAIALACIEISFDQRKHPIEYTHWMGGLTHRVSIHLSPAAIIAAFGRDELEAACKEAKKGKNHER